MASISKTKSGKWRFVTTINYKQHSCTFETKAEGYAWEEEIKSGKVNKTPNITFGKLLEKYVAEVSIKKKGERWERIRVQKFIKDNKLANIKIGSLTKSDFADWRDQRLTEVSAASVLREWALLSHCLYVAVEDWEYLTINPMKGVRKPQGHPPRDRLVTESEKQALFGALNYSYEATLQTITSQVGAAFAFALETAMRAQEICNLEWADVKGSVAKINASKTFTGIREVPLSKKALGIIEQCKGLNDRLVFNIKTSQLDALFRKAKSNALIEGLHFHDSRATAITNLSKKLDVLELSRMVGHKDLKMLLVYYRETASNLAKKLD